MWGSAVAASDAMFPRAARSAAPLEAVLKAAARVAVLRLCVQAAMHADVYSMNKLRTATQNATLEAVLRASKWQNIMDFPTFCSPVFHTPQQQMPRCHRTAHSRYACCCMLLCVAACCCMFQHVAACGCVLLHVAACGCMWLHVAACYCVLLHVAACGCGCVLLYVAACFCVLLHAAASCRMLMHVDAYLYMLLHVAVCCCVLLHVAACCRMLTPSA